MLNEKDHQLIDKKGITPADISLQVQRFESGFPRLKIHSVATVGNGIMRLNDKDLNHFIKIWKERPAGISIEKFVPASGAASRMFKNMFAFVTSGRTEPTTDFEKQYFNEINHFAFHTALNKACQRRYGAGITQLMEEGRWVDIVKAMLEPEGLNYGFLPKALLKFHKAAGGTVHTPVEEHLEEGAQYAAAARKVNIHFTVSGEHRGEFEKKLKTAVPVMEQVWGVKYAVTMSEQKASTDTIAVNTDNTPYRDSDGNLLFRPAGHGALIENLNERDAHVVFIKNIDNVVPLRLRNSTVRYKKALAGYLIDVQRSITRHLNTLDKGSAGDDELKKILKFVENRLCTFSDATATMNSDELAEYLRTKLNRPIRVCGMVLNEGEPGGGPYLAYNSDGSYSPQILEEAQIDPGDPRAVELMKSGTHFNPVDLVCYLKDYKGRKFNLKDFVDYDTGLISMKSTGGVEIKALELPGLWNGSMSDWNTVFVEVPISTFNPVKTVNDLLRPQHQ